MPLIPNRRAGRITARIGAVLAIVGVVAALAAACLLIYALTLPH